MAREIQEAVVEQVFDVNANKRMEEISSRFGVN